ncbi:MAG: hypothetical protein MJZ12_01650 [Prevotella sp.]|nr:hypothetical protein [Prevotella sp.]
MDYNAKFKENEKVKLMFTGDEVVNISWAEGIKVLPDTYGGPYDVIPTVEGLTLYTKDKTMTDDVTVEEIPFIEAENLQGGYTATIG